MLSGVDLRISHIHVIDFKSTCKGMQKVFPPNKLRKYRNPQQQIFEGTKLTICYFCRNKKVLNPICNLIYSISL